MRKFELKGRDVVVASFTEAMGLAEIFKALSKQDGPALLRISNFGCRVAFEALAEYGAALVEKLGDSKADLTLELVPEVVRVPDSGKDA